MLLMFWDKLLLFVDEILANELFVKFSPLMLTVLTLCAIGVVAALVLYFVSQKFKDSKHQR